MGIAFLVGEINFGLYILLGSVESGMDVVTSNTNAIVLEATQFCSLLSPPSLFYMKFDKDMTLKSGSFTPSLLCKY